MLLRFRFSNFRSFRREQELSLMAARISGPEGGLIQRPHSNDAVLPVAAIYGANASGKTNALRALEYMSLAVQNSHRLWEPDGEIPREPFLLHDSCRIAPSEFVIDLDLGGVRFQYGFALKAKSVEREWLYSYPQGKRQAWFERRQGKPVKFSAKMTGENRQIERLMRSNSLFLSVAAQNNHQQLLPVYEWFSRRLMTVSPDVGTGLPPLVEALQTEKTLGAQLAEILQAADTGIVGVGAKRVDLSPVPKREISSAIATHSNSKPAKKESAAVGRVFVSHSSTRIEFQHRTPQGAVPLGFESESRGTLTYLVLVRYVMHALNTGALLLVDELDASLHSALARQLVQVFNDRARNPKAAQLIFNTHDTNLLSSGDLRRDQIWFTEKDRSGESHLYPLTDFKPRVGENLESGYLQGRYGAIPFLGSAPFAAIFGEDDGTKR